MKQELSGKKIIVGPYHYGTKELRMLGYDKKDLTKKRKRKSYSVGRNQYGCYIYEISGVRIVAVQCTVCIDPKLH